MQSDSFVRTLTSTSNTFHLIDRSRHHRDVNNTISTVAQIIYLLHNFYYRHCLLHADCCCQLESRNNWWSVSETKANKRHSLQRVKATIKNYSQAEPLKCFIQNSFNLLIRQCYFCNYFNEPCWLLSCIIPHIYFEGGELKFINLCNTTGSSSHLQA